MKRWIFAVLGGIAIPLCYMIVVVWAGRFINNDTSLSLLLAPIKWAYWLVTLFVSDTSPVVNIALSVGNFLLYTLLTYAFLSWRNIPRPMTKHPSSNNC